MSGMKYTFEENDYVNQNYLSVTGRHIFNWILKSGVKFTMQGWHLIAQGLK